MRRVVTGLVVMLMLPAALAAQSADETRYYPEELYPGENIVTITNPNGIERVSFRPSSGVKVTVPKILGCPKSVDVRVVVDNAVEQESVGFTTYDCRGGFGPQTLASTNWTILHHRIGPLAVGRDTCTDAMVSIGVGGAEGLRTGSEKIIDSMVSDHPAVTIVMPAREAGRWIARPGAPLPYRICFSSANPDTITTSLRLYIRRRQPHQGLTDYVIIKPVTALAFVPPPPPPPKKPDPNAGPVLPPLVDPTTFRNVLMPTAETLPQGRFFVGNFDLAGWLGGYGITDDLMVMGGGAYIPEFVQQVAMVTIGAKYRALSIGPVQASVAAQYAYSSSETDISVIAPFGVVSIGDRATRISVAAGYAWKRHTNDVTSFDENATAFAIGGDVSLKRGWKLLAETYFIEKSGLQPITVTSRWFGERFAFDLGLIVDLKGTSDIQGTGTLSGEIKEVRAAPLLSLVMIF
ncbi:MAG TPA: hypothetical protein VNA88_05390 [Candidatus Kapabacteria bacterium]|nr:hypothetical protein [Candidatus Kapabacteria bacterium]